MRDWSGRLTLAAALTCAAVVPAAAADVRDALGGKTIIVSWSEFGPGNGYFLWR